MILLHRIIALETEISRVMAAPTLPIYDPSNPPEDAVECQVFIGTDNSLNWYSSGSWHTKAGVLSTVNNTPQDVIEGQIVIGADDSLHWFVNGDWYTAVFAATGGNPPQDAVIGQIAVGNSDNFCWYSNGSWYSLAS